MKKVLVTIRNEELFWTVSSWKNICEIVISSKKNSNHISFQLDPVTILYVTDSEFYS